MYLTLQKVKKNVSVVFYRCMQTIVKKLTLFTAVILQQLYYIIWSGKRDSNSRLQPWQGCALPLNYSRLGNKVVRMKGVEPPRRRRQILSLVRLPIPPHPHFTLYIVGGGWWIRTTESNANRFTVCPLWPLGKSSTLELVIGIEPTTC